MVDRTQAEQPHWMPLPVTAPARLLQLYRYDNLWQSGINGVSTLNHGGSKGIIFIPQEKLEIILFAPPPYIVHNHSPAKDGFGDWGFTVKYRIAAANEQHGNYVVSAAVQTTLPTGQYKNGQSNMVVTPTLLYGKGFGPFDVQGSFGATLPTGNVRMIGRSFSWNNGLQYHFFKKFWPDAEVNYTHFQDGPLRGKTQVFMTPGIIFGNFELWKRLKLNFGGGYQIATTHFHVNNHNGIFTLRIPF